MVAFKFDIGERGRRSALYPGLKLPGPSGPVSAEGLIFTNPAGMSTTNSKCLQQPDVSGQAGWLASCATLTEVCFGGAGAGIHALVPHPPHPPHLPGAATLCCASRPGVRGRPRRRYCSTRTTTPRWGRVRGRQAQMCRYRCALFSGATLDERKSSPGTCPVAPVGASDCASVVSVSLEIARVIIANPAVKVGPSPLEEGWNRRDAGGWHRQPVSCSWGTAYARQWRRPTSRISALVALPHPAPAPRPTGHPVQRRRGDVEPGGQRLHGQQPVGGRCR